MNYKVESQRFHGTAGSAKDNSRPLSGVRLKTFYLEGENAVLTLLGHCSLSGEVQEFTVN